MLYSHIKKHLGTNKDALHHAYFIEGEQDLLIPALNTFIEKDLGVKIKGNHDYWCKSFETFTISDARELKKTQSKKAFSDDLRIFVLGLDTFTREAQNSLLKIFEEPAEQTVFFVVSPSLSGILPTLESRMITIPRYVGGGQEKDELYTSAEVFLRAGKGERLSFIEKFTKEVNSIEATRFLNYLEEFLYKKNREDKLSKDDVAIFGAIDTCRSYLRLRGAGVKGVFEYLAFMIPRVS